MALALAPPSMAGTVPGFPHPLKAPIGGSAASADLGGTGDLSVVVGAGNKVFAFSSDGKPVAGFPVDLGKDEQIVGDVGAADLNGDRRAEVAVATKSGKLFVLSGAGAPLPGFPRKLEGGCGAGPSFADVDADGLPELLLGDGAGRLHAWNDARGELAGFPVMLGTPLTSSVSVGRLREKLVLAVGSQSGKVFVLLPSGKPLPGFELAANAAVTGPPAFGDLDDDGRIDLMVASWDFKVHAVNDEGKPLAGFPLVTGLGCIGGPALADLDGDGDLDLAVTSSDGMLYVVDGAGRALPGYPVSLGPMLKAGVVMGDIDRDGRLDLVTVATDGRVHALTGRAERVPGFPARMTGMLVGTPLLSAPRRDGDLSVYVGSPDGTFTAFRADRKQSAAAAAPWPASGRDSSREGWFHPSPPRYKELAVQPEKPRVDDALEPRWRFFTADGTPEPESTISWFRENKQVKELDGVKKVPPRTARKNERWHFELTVAGRKFKGPDVTIADTPPTSPQVRVVPPVLTRETPAKVEVTTPGVDPDGNPVTYRITWLANGAPAKVSGDTVPAARLTKGERWTAVVTAFDGALESQPATTEALVVSAPPTGPAVELEPAAPKRGEPIRAVIKRPATDLDGDPLTYRYAWTVNGKVRNYPWETATLPADVARKGEQVNVSVVAFDGELEGPVAKASAQLKNTVPRAPKPALLPPAPRAGEKLRAVVLEPAVDVDGDPVTYKASWSRDGKPWSPPGDPFEVPASEIVKGGRWVVQLAPSDPEGAGPVGSAEAVVQNTPPEAPLVALSPAVPRVGAPVQSSLPRPSKDVDRDPVKYRYAWTRNGKPLGEADGKTSLGGSDFKKHDTLRLTVTPSDGQLDGLPGAAEVQVANAPPTAPAVTVEPARPTVQGPLKAIIAKPSQDLDQDTLVYKYVWLKDGVPQPLPESQAEIPATMLQKNERWTVVVRAFDGEEHSPQAQAQATVANAAPPSPKVGLSPTAPRRRQGLLAQVTAQDDPDGDPVSYRFEWKRDGKPVLGPESLGVRGDDPQGPKKGELWSVDVYATDGLDTSLPAHAEVRIGNTPPQAPALSLCDGPLAAGAAIGVKIATASVDVDDDPVTYDYQWTSNGKAMPSWKGRSSLGAGDTRKHDVVRVTAVPSDGTDVGKSASAECTIDDTAPTGFELSLAPANPTADTGVTARVTRPATDHDGDPITYRYVWTRNGAPIAAAGDGSSIAKGALRRGDVVQVTATAYDGERAGPEVAVSATMANALPPVPRVAASPAKPTAGAAITCSAESPATDADGETLRVHYAWLRDGKPSGLSEDQATLAPGLVKKGETWRCEAWTDDGLALSARAGAQVTAVNSEPTAPKIAIEPERPQSTRELRCRVLTDSTDADQDPISYEYKWARNGKPYAPPGDPTLVPAKETKKGEKWQCTVKPSDGTAAGAVATVEVTVQNSPPAPVPVRISPARPKAEQPLTCELAGSATDPDGDSLTLAFTWVKDGVPQGFSPTSPQVPARMVTTAQLWSCRLQISDGQLQSPVTESGTLAIEPDPDAAPRPDRRPTAPARPRR